MGTGHSKSASPLSMTSSPSRSSSERLRNSSSWSSSSSSSGYPSSISSSSFCSSSSPSSYHYLGFIDDLLSVTVLHPTNRQYPVARDYQISFLDFLATLFPYNEIDSRERVRELKTSIDSSAAGGHSFKTYSIGREKSITLLESESQVDEDHDGTTGLWTTSASFILSSWLRHHRRLIAGRSVVELGCGCGFVG